MKRSRFWDGSSAWPWEHRLDKYLKERLHVYAAVRKAFSGAGVPEGSRQRFYEVLYGVEDDPAAERYWRLTGQILRAFRESASRAGAELILVYAPAIVQVEEENWRMKRDLFGLIGEFDLDKPNRRLGAAAARDGIPLLDLSSAFRKHTGPPAPLLRREPLDAGGPRPGGASGGRLPAPAAAAGGLPLARGRRRPGCPRQARRARRPPARRAAAGGR